MQGQCPKCSRSYEISKEFLAMGGKAKCPHCLLELDFGGAATERASATKTASEKTRLRDTRSPALEQPLRSPDQPDEIEARCPRCNQRFMVDNTYLRKGGQAKCPSCSVDLLFDLSRSKPPQSVPVGGKTVVMNDPAPGSAIDRSPRTQVVSADAPREATNIVSGPELESLLKSAALCDPAERSDDRGDSLQGEARKKGKKAQKVRTSTAAPVDALDEKTEQYSGRMAADQLFDALQDRGAEESPATLGNDQATRQGPLPAEIEQLLSGDKPVAERDGDFDSVMETPVENRPTPEQAAPERFDSSEERDLDDDQTGSLPGAAAVETELINYSQQSAPSVTTYPRNSDEWIQAAEKWAKEGFNPESMPAFLRGNQQASTPQASPTGRGEKDIGRATENRATPQAPAPERELDLLEGEKGTPVEKGAPVDRGAPAKPAKFARQPTERVRERNADNTEVPDPAQLPVPRRRFLRSLVTILALVLVGGGVFEVWLFLRDSEDIEKIRFPADISARIILAPPPTNRQTTPQALRYYGMGNRDVHLGNYELALAKYQYITQKIDPRYPLAHRALGIVYAALGRPELSAQAYENYLRLWPTSPDATQVREILKQSRPK